MHIVESSEHEQALADVQEWFERSEGPALRTMTRASGLRVNQDGSAIAVLGTALSSATERSERRIRIVRPEIDKTTEFADDGAAVTWLGADLVTASRSVRLRRGPSWQPTGRFDLPGTAEQIVPSPDGRRLALVLAPDQTDSWDPAPVPERADDPFRPSVYRSGPERARELWILDPQNADAPLLRVHSSTWNIWECAWTDEDRIAVIASAETGETGWYRPVIGTLPARAEGPADPLTVVHRPSDDAQLASIVAEGTIIAAVEGIASDRGLTVGRIVLPGAEPRVLDVDAEVSHITLRDGRLAWAGLRGLRTVAGLVQLEDPARNVQLFDGAETFVGALPAVEQDESGRLYAVVESYTTPPRLERITADGRTTLMDLTHDGAVASARTAGSCRDVEWTAPDGLRIQGLLVAPSGPGPHPLLMVVHGGPVAAWRERWGIQNVNRHPHAGLLAENGIATFYPNPRGSVGRGQDFTRLVRGDMCGADVDDLLSGIDHLIATGVADPDRIGVTGNSYGGTMSAWLSATTDRFRVAIVTSPATDLVSQHHLSNIPAFDELFVAGRVESDADRYYARSPLSRAHLSTTPTLVTAGELDKCTPPSQAVELHQAIRRAGGSTELVLYPRQAHGIADFPETIDFLARLLSWSRRFLLG